MTDERGPLLDARQTLFAIAGGELLMVTPEAARVLLAKLYDLGRDNARLVRRIETATKDLQAQADKLVSQVVSEERRAHAAERKLRRARMRLRAMSRARKNT